jgi:SAM-dependent methyltransferase
VCGTLVSLQQPLEPVLRVTNEATDFYGRDYWFRHQEMDLKQANLEVRARRDLSERCLHWLSVFLRYQLPPARVLELGCGHGGFVAMLRWLGFDAIGLELSPSVVAYAQKIFGVPMLCGPIEDHSMPDGSLDAIVLMDVLEHLPDPIGTMRQALTLLKPDGFLLIQTPRVPIDTSYEQLLATNDRFLEQFKPNEHLYMFTESSLRKLFDELGAEHVVFEPAIFAWYDMFAVVSRQPLFTHQRHEVERTLLSSPSGRLILALLEASQTEREVRERLALAEADGTARLASIAKLQALLDESEKDRAARLWDVETLQALLNKSDEDRAARLQTIEHLSSQLQEMDRDHLQEIQDLHMRLALSDEDRAARLAVIEETGRRLAAMNEELNRVRGELAARRAESHSGV